MAFEKIHNKGQAQLFGNPLIERLTKSHPLVIWSLYSPVVIGFPVYAHFNLGIGWTPTISYFLAGLFSWTLVEYFIHRYIFHYKPTSAIGMKISYLFHGNHHHYPRDKQRLFMPPIPSVIITTIFFLLFYGMMGNNAFFFFSGFLLGYLLYGSMHYAIHAYAPPFKWMKPLWRNHHLHHYKEEDKGFGVSTTLWDRVFGTMYDLKKEKEDLEKAKELMY